MDVALSSLTYNHARKERSKSKSCHTYLGFLSPESHWAATGLT
jgi:hypothetical protein